MYLIQSSNLPYDRQLELAEELTDMEIPFEDYGIVPFTDELTGIREQYDEPVILLGSCKAINLVKKYPQVNPGVFFDEQTFNVNVWNGILQSAMLNFDSINRSVEKLAQGFDGYLFIRPLTDLKLFSGMVVNHSEFMEWWDYNKYKGGDPIYDIPGSMVVSVAPPKQIMAEWRCFTLNGKVISGSQYKKNDQLDISDSCPDEVIGYANSIIDLWRPHDIVVVDICQLRDNTYRIVEFNCFNGSGWYKADKRKVLKAVHDYVLG